jgi:hypothetical protein
MTPNWQTGLSISAQRKINFLRSALKSSTALDLSGMLKRKSGTRRLNSSRYTSRITVIALFPKATLLMISYWAWVKHQCQAAKKEAFPEERREKLVSIGFVWKVER